MNELSAISRDLRSEAEALRLVLHTFTDSQWHMPTAFKSWTTWDVLVHLYLSDYMALATLRDPAEFNLILNDLRSEPGSEYAKRKLITLQEKRDPGKFLKKWYGTLLQLCDAFQQADPETRFQWVGPLMKARTLATARQMEIWAHGWEVYDLLHLTREHNDSVKNIADLGVRTYKWTFSNRGIENLRPRPLVKLIAPSGAIWEWDSPAQDDLIEGTALEFCQVVTQVRNVGDTQLNISGSNAMQWMQLAQCFAGPPSDPPLLGSRVWRAEESLY